MKRRWIAVIVFLIGLAVVIWIVGQNIAWKWLGIYQYDYGFDQGKLVPIGVVDIKTIWDLLELLIVPTVIAVGVWWLNLSTHRHEQELAKQRDEIERKTVADRHHQLVLESYFDRMSHLLLEQKLRESEYNDEVRGIARSRTIVVLQSLDDERKKQVLQFLYLSGLIDKKPIVPLSDFNLEGIDLSGMSFYGANLAGIKFTRATFVGSKLSKVSFYNSDLQHANLDRAFLTGAILNDTNLSYAKLTQCNFSTDLSKRGPSYVEIPFENAQIMQANLSNSDLSGSFLKEVPLNYSNLDGANLSNTNLDGANFSGSNCKNTNFSKSRATNTWFIDCDLSGSDFSNADLTGASLDNVNLKNAKISIEQLLSVKALRGKKTIMMDGSDLESWSHRNLFNLKESTNESVESEETT